MILKKFVLIMVAGLALVLAGCQNQGTDLARTLSSAQANGRTEVGVDFGKEFSGSWTRAVIACIGTTNAQLNDALGFRWSGAPDLSDDSFLSVIVLATDTQVESSIATGPDSDWTYIPCPETHATTSNPTIVSVPRKSSQVSFSLDSSDQGRWRWYVSSREFASLANR